jgi:hypothetical protein
MPKFLFPIFFLTLSSLFGLLYLFIKIDPENQNLVIFIEFSLAVFVIITFGLSLILFFASLLLQFLVKKTTRRIQLNSSEDLRKRFRLFFKISFLPGIFLGTLAFLKLVTLLNLFNLIILSVILLTFGYFWLFEN